jgi:hypothetical protein
MYPPFSLGAIACLIFSIEIPVGGVGRVGILVGAGVPVIEDGRGVRRRDIGFWLWIGHGCWV